MAPMLSPMYLDTIGDRDGLVARTANVDDRRCVGQ